MAITRSSAADRALGPGRRRGSASGPRRLELYLLLSASLVIVAGLVLLHGARAALTDTGTQLLNLNQVKSANELLAVLTFLTDPEDRNFAARRIFEHLGAESLGSVGDLRLIRVSSEQIRKSRGLSTFAARLQDARRQAAPGASVSIPLLTPAQVRMLRRLVEVRSPAEFSRALILYALVFFFAFYGAHFYWSRRGFAGDQILMPVSLLLSGIGLILMVRLRDPLREDLLFPDFAIGAALGCLVLVALSLPDYERTALRRLAYIPLACSFLVSVVLLVFGSGPGVSDAKVNLRIGPVSTQPVELIKILLVLFLAGYFANRWEFFRELRERSGALPTVLSGWNVPRLQYAVPLVAAVAIAILFFFLQKDLGPALVMLVLFLLLYTVARSRALGAVIGVCILIASFAVGYRLSFPRTVVSRVNIWLSPWDNFVRPGGDHLAQSLWTFSSGGFFGAGLGMGEPGSVPAVHTDLILAAAGEELGFLGLVAIYALYAVFLTRCLRLCRSAAGHYTFFLGLGLTLLVGLQVALISGGVLGLFPLSGVVTPYLNYGKSSAIVNFAILGILLSISANPGPADRNAPFRKPLAGIMLVFGVVAAVVVVQAARVQVFSAGKTMVSGALVLQADGHRRYMYNPRLVEASEAIPRGSIFDRNGIPLATSSEPEIEQHRGEYERLAVDVNQLPRGSGRKYPFGALTYHIVGDLPTRLNWGAPNTSYIERDLNVTLQGYDDRAAIVDVSDRPGGPTHPVLRRDLRELIPLVRYRYRPEQKQVQEILSRDRGVHLTVDIRLQKAVAEIAQRQIRVAGLERGAAIVIDPVNGDLLASVTYPFAGAAEAVHILSVSDDTADISGFRDSLLDRPRYGLYPPGSSFKIVTASAALQVRENVQNEKFECRRLPDGRIGNYVRGWGRPIRDDVMDKVPHGAVDMAKGIIQSCNAYFAQLGTYVVGTGRLFQMAENYGIRVASPNTAAQLRDALPQASYGQGQVVATPLQMARVAASIATGGMSQPVRWVPVEASPAGRKLIPAEHATLLAQYMRRVVTEGTGRAAATATVPIAGKTGTAELHDKPSHAWFIGFAPYGNPAGKTIAFACIVENGRYGGRVAAPLAAEIVSAAQRLAIIEK